MNQLELFDLGSIEKVEARPKPTRWYYITRRRNQEMLHYFASDGTPVWTENDPRNVTPHTWVSARAAQSVLRLVGGTEVRRYLRR